MNFAISIQHLSHQYGKTQALKEVSLQIPQGVTVGLIGPDGVGKSTLLSLISGVKILQQGDISVFGLNIADSKARDQLSHKIAFMPQGLGKNLYPTLFMKILSFTLVFTTCRKPTVKLGSNGYCKRRGYCPLPTDQPENYRAE